MIEEITTVEFANQHIEFNMVLRGKDKIEVAVVGVVKYHSLIEDLVEIKG